MTQNNTFLLDLLKDIQSQIEALAPILRREQCKDDYEHGHKNGAFFILVELRRAIKEEITPSRPAPFPARGEENRIAFKG